MTGRRSPIEMMIDAATGYRPGATPPPSWIVLRCRVCGRTKRAPKDDTDPLNTFYVEAPCDRCDRGGDKPETMYFDAQDRQLHPETGELLTPAEERQHD